MPYRWGSTACGVVCSQALRAGLSRRYDGIHTHFQVLSSMFMKIALLSSFLFLFPLHLRDPLRRHFLAFQQEKIDVY